MENKNTKYAKQKCKQFLFWKHIKTMNMKWNKQDYGAKSSLKFMLNKPKVLMMTFFILHIKIF
jgi:hypothetical protein